MEFSGLFSDYLSLMFGKPRIRQNNLKTSLIFLDSCVLFSISSSAVKVHDSQADKGFRGQREIMHRAVF